MGWTHGTNTKSTSPSIRKKKGTVVPAEGQHQNGLSESLVKPMKRSIKQKIGENVLSFAELQTAIFEIANIINSRPIGIVLGSNPEQPPPIIPLLHLAKFELYLSFHKEQVMTIGDLRG